MSIEDVPLEIVLLMKVTRFETICKLRVSWLVLANRAGKVATAGLSLQRLVQRFNESNNR